MYGNTVIQDEAVVMIVSPFLLLPCAAISSNQHPAECEASGGARRIQE
jgi:hypothetical protein